MVNSSFNFVSNEHVFGTLILCYVPKWYVERGGGAGKGSAMNKSLNL